MFRRCAVLVASATITAMAGIVSGQPEAPTALPDSAGESLLRGPVHEAFAKPHSFDAEPTEIHSQAPPEPIDEVPPDIRPEGKNVTWIPGYWSWDDERDDYIWISGVWRAVPPGRRWLPGYWHETAKGFQWISGTWIPAKTNQPEYIPKPPATLERGPTSAEAPKDQFWIPGCWKYQRGVFVWRPGFWSGCHDNWIWIPSCYSWTPWGYIYVPGYWDYPWDRRGVLFAPCHFATSAITKPGFFFTPRVLINCDEIFLHLWVHSSRRCYYHGDFYGPRYSRLGYRSWFTHHLHRHGHDPHYAFYRRRHLAHQKTPFHGHLRERHDHYLNNPRARPPRTLKEHDRIHTVSKTPVRHSPSRIAHRLSEELKGKHTRLSLTRASTELVKKARERQLAIRGETERRRRTEASRGSDIVRSLRSRQDRLRGSVSTSRGDSSPPGSRRRFSSSDRSASSRLREDDAAARRRVSRSARMYSELIQRLRQRRGSDPDRGASRRVITRDVITPRQRTDTRTEPSRQRNGIVPSRNVDRIRQIVESMSRRKAQSQQSSSRATPEANKRVSRETASSSRDAVRRILQRRPRPSQRAETPSPRRTVDRARRNIGPTKANSRANGRISAARNAARRAAGARRAGKGHRGQSTSRGGRRATRGGKD